MSILDSSFRAKSELGRKIKLIIFFFPKKNNYFRSGKKSAYAADFPHSGARGCRIPLVRDEGVPSGVCRFGHKIFKILKISKIGNFQNFWKFWTKNFQKLEIFGPKIFKNLKIFGPIFSGFSYFSGGRGFRGPGSDSGPGSLNAMGPVPDWSPGALGMQIFGENSENFQKIFILKIFKNFRNFYFWKFRIFGNFRKKFSKIFRENFEIFRKIFGKIFRKISEDPKFFEIFENFSHFPKISWMGNFSKCRKIFRPVPQRGVFLKWNF